MSKNPRQLFPSVEAVERQSVINRANRGKPCNDRNEAIKAAAVFTPETKPARKTAAPQVRGHIRAGRLLGLKMLLPIKTVSEANSRDCWAVKNRRKRAQQEELKIEWARLVPKLQVALPCTVRLTRLGMKKLDSDNLASSCKGIRDSIAKQIGVDDGSELITWEYAQQPTASARIYGIEIEITTR